MRKVSVPVGAGYDILIGAGLLGQTGKLIAERFTPSRVAIITDSTVDKLYAHRLLSSLQEAGLCPCKYVFPAGERSKNLGVYGEILEFLASHELDRSSLIIALGGGVAVVAAFLAACFVGHGPTALGAQDAVVVDGLARGAERLAGMAGLGACGRLVVAGAINRHHVRDGALLALAAASDFGGVRYSCHGAHFSRFPADVPFLLAPSNFRQKSEQPQNDDVDVTSVILRLHFSQTGLFWSPVSHELTLVTGRP